VLHLEHSLCDAEIRTLRKVDQEYLKMFEIVVVDKDGEDQLDRSCEK
jgi:hypothetical protein